MFGFLKKKLHDAVAKVTGKVESSESIEQEKNETKSEAFPQRDETSATASAAERLDQEIQEHIEEVEEIGEKVKEERIAKDLQDVKEEKHEYEETKKEVEKERKLSLIEETVIEAEKAEPIEEFKEAELEAEAEELNLEPEKEIEEEIKREEAKVPSRPLLETVVEEAKPKKSFLRGLLKREKTGKVEKFEPSRGLLKRVVEKTLSESEIEEILKELQIALLESDVAVEVAERISDDIKRALTGTAVKRGKVEEIIKQALHDAILDILDQPKIDLEQRIREKDGPFLITIVGFNGCGKTTTVARLAHRLKKFKPVLAAGDTFRAASIEQLEEHAKRLGVDIVKHRYGADSAAVIFDAVKHAAAVKSKLVLADTAGRSHTNANLMDELKKVMRVDKPDLKILVLDALAGNDIYDQAQLFDKAVGIDAIILTKADVYEKGGAALSAAYTLKKPILFLGVGQEYGDLEPFDAHKIVENLVG